MRRAKGGGFEISKLTDMLKDKEQMLAQAGELMSEAERHCEMHREKVESLEVDKKMALDEANAARELLQQTKDKYEFELSEKSVHLEKVEEKNAQLVKDLEENSRLAQVAAQPVLSMDLSNESSSESSNNNNNNNRTTSSDAAAAEMDDLQLMDHDPRLTPQEYANLETTIGPLSPPTTKFIKAREDQWYEELKKYNSKKALRSPGGGKDSDHARHLADMESQRAKLTEDLQACCNKNLELEMQLDQVRKFPNDQNTHVLATERERKHMRSLQQRLEQLVAVHRQLLRKFHAVELDSSEKAKKIMLRDERILQLEKNNRNLAANMRTQAERHVSELTKLREQVSSVREENMIMSRIEAANSNAPGQSNSGHTGRSRVFRGGASDGSHVRAIRGGSRPPVQRSRQTEGTSQQQ